MVEDGTPPGVLATRDLGEVKVGGEDDLGDFVLTFTQCLGEDGDPELVSDYFHLCNQVNGEEIKKRPPWSTIDRSQRSHNKRDVGDSELRASQECHQVCTNFRLNRHETYVTDA